MNRRNFITTLTAGITVGITGLLVPTTKANIIKNTPSVKGYPIHFDYWSGFENLIVGVTFKEDYMEEKVITTIMSNILANDTIYEESVNSDMLYIPYTTLAKDSIESFTSVCVAKNRFGSSGYFSRSDFAEQMTNIIKMEYPRRQIESASFGTSNGHKTRLTHFTT